MQRIVGPLNCRCRFLVCFCPFAVVVVRFSPWVTSSISIQLLQMWNDAPVSYIQESLVSNSVSGFADDKQIAFMLYWNTFSVALIVVTRLVFLFCHRFYYSVSIPIPESLLVTRTDFHLVAGHPGTYDKYTVDCGVSCNLDI